MYNTAHFMAQTTLQSSPSILLCVFYLSIEKPDVIHATLFYIKYLLAYMICYENIVFPQLLLTGKSTQRTKTLKSLQTKNNSPSGLCINFPTSTSS